MKQLCVALVALVVLLAVVGCSEPVSQESSSFEPTSSERAGADSLLAGMTPANLRVPAGWRVAATQDFESGTLPAGQSMCEGTKITTALAHSGTHSASNTISSDGACVNWIYNRDQLHGREFYLSYYDYGNGALFNEEYVLNHVIKLGIGGSPGFEEAGAGATLKYNTPGPAGGLLFNDPNPVMTGGGAQGNFVATDSWGPVISGYGSSGWNQWEMWGKLNTPNQSDGFFRVYRNGKLVWSLEDKNFSGPIDMSGMQVEAGGWYTKNIWRLNDGSCAPSAAATGAAEKGACQSFNNCACPPNPPIFTRYIDDIILLQR